MANKFLNDTGLTTLWTKVDDKFVRKDAFNTALSGKSDVGHTHSYLPLSGGTLTGDLNFQYAYNITWADGSWWQRFGITDDATSDTPVFKFQQSSNTGDTWTDLLTIRDNGKIIANTFIGNLNGKADTSGYADAAYAVTSYSTASYSSDKRKIWFDRVGYTGHLAVSDNLTFQTSTNTLFSPNFSGYLIGDCSGSSESTYVLNQIRLSTESLNDLYTPGRMYFAGGGNAVTNKPTSVDAFGLLNIRAALGLYGQLLLSSNQSTGLYYRADAHSSNNWRKLLDSSNYTDYTVTKTGSGASGSWSINITGSSASCTGNAATATTAGHATTAGSLTSWVEASGGSWRYLWMSHSDNSNNVAYSGTVTANVSDGAIKCQSGNDYSIIAPAYIKLRKYSATDPSANNASIEFSYNDGKQCVYLGYSPNDSYRISKGLKVFGDADDNSNVWFEVEGFTYANGFVKHGSSDSYVLLGSGGHKAVSDFATSGHNHSELYYEVAINRTKNTVLAAPNGSNGVATFRSLVAADIPSKLDATTIESSAWGSQLILNRTGSSGSWGPSIIFNYDGTCNGSLTMASNKLYVGDNGSSRTEVSLVGHTHDYAATNHNHGNTYFKVNDQTTTGTGDIYLELWRGRNASWKMLNTGGDLKFQSNYTTSAGNYFDCMILEYSTGNMWLKGTVTATGFYENSDERLKDFEDDIDIDLNALKKIPKKYFKFKEDPTTTHIGTSAQVIKELYPELVTENEEGYLSVDYAKLSIIALKAVDELYEDNKNIKDRLNKIETLLNIQNL